MRKTYRVLASVFIVLAMVSPILISTPVSAATVTYSTDATSSTTSRYKSHAVYATAQTSATSDGTRVANYQVGQDLAGGSYYVDRTFLYFNTTNVPAVTISTAILRVYCTGIGGSTAYNIVVQCGAAAAPSTYPHDPYVVADYDTSLYATSGGSIAVASMGSDDYNDITLDATGIGFINDGGTTTLVLRSSKDISATAPVGSEYVLLSTTIKPQLILTFDSTSIVDTIIATEIEPTRATLNGALYVMLGNFTACSFEYGTSTSYGTTTTSSALTSIGTFAQSITGLNYATTYHFRAIANYGVDTYYGEDKTFTTMAALGASTDLIIRSANVFSTFGASGDMLVAFETQCTYPPHYPTAKPTDYFQVQLVDTDTTTVLAAVGLPAWGDRPGAIYLKPSIAATLTPQTAYIIRLKGVGVTGTPSEDYTLTDDDWKGSDLTRLDAWVIATAENMERTDRNYDSSVDYVATSNNQDKILSDSGGAYFVAGIPGLVLERPNLFTTSMGGVAVLLGADAGVWDSPNAWEANMGAGLVSDLTVFGGLLGIPARTMMMGVFVGLVILIIIAVGSLSQGTTALGVVAASFSIIWCGVYFKVFPSTVIIIIVLVCLVAFAIKLGQWVSQ